MPVAMTNLASENVSRLNTVWRSSLVAIEKNKAYSENVTTAMVCAISCGCARSAQQGTPTAPAPITSPAETSQTNRPRFRMGSSGGAASIPSSRAIEDRRGAGKQLVRGALDEAADHLVTRLRRHQAGDG